MSADDGAVEALLCLEELSVDVPLVVLEMLLPLFVEFISHQSLDHILTQRSCQQAKDLDWAHVAGLGLCIVTNVNRLTD
jgi:hypothetical protein